MKTALLDVNVLAALMWPAHQNYAAAHAWSQRRGHARWATCPLTELGFLRLIMNRSFSREALTFNNAVALLRQAVSQDAHEFWGDGLSVTSSIEKLASHIQGHGQITDAYLLCLAKHHKGVLATFDQGLSSFAVSEFALSLEVIPAV